MSGATSRQESGDFGSTTAEALFYIRGSAGRLSGSSTPPAFVQDGRGQSDCGPHLLPPAEHRPSHIPGRIRVNLANRKPIFAPHLDWSLHVLVEDQFGGRTLANMCPLGQNWSDGVMEPDPTDLHVVGEPIDETGAETEPVDHPARADVRMVFSKKVDRSPLPVELRSKEVFKWHVATLLRAHPTAPSRSSSRKAGALPGWRRAGAGDNYLGRSSHAYGLTQRPAKPRRRGPTGRQRPPIRPRVAITARNTEPERGGPRMGLIEIRTPSRRANTRV